MSCPHFEPLFVLPEPGQTSATRLPLVELYDGHCRAAETPFPVPREHRVSCCNHGNSRSNCAHFPRQETRTAIRHIVVSRSAASLTILCIEERDYAPLRWHTACYSIETGRLESELIDVCLLAQASAFCQSYLRRFPLQQSSN